MSRRWIRLDLEWEHSVWIDALSGQAAGCWPRLLVWVATYGARGRCRAPDAKILGRRWKVPSDAVHELMGAGLRDGALRMDGRDLVVENWSRYQEPDPTATERKRRQRQGAARNGSGDVTAMSRSVTHVTRDPVA